MRYSLSELDTARAAYTPAGELTENGRDYFKLVKRSAKREWRRRMIKLSLITVAMAAPALSAWRASAAADTYYDQDDWESIATLLGGVAGLSWLMFVMPQLRSTGQQRTQVYRRLSLYRREWPEIAALSEHEFNAMRRGVARGALGRSAAKGIFSIVTGVLGLPGLGDSLGD